MTTIVFYKNLCPCITSGSFPTRTQAPADKNVIFFLVISLALDLVVLVKYFESSKHLQAYLIRYP